MLRNGVIFGRQSVVPWIWLSLKFKEGDGRWPFLLIDCCNEIQITDRLSIWFLALVQSLEEVSIGFCEVLCRWDSDVPLDARFVTCPQPRRCLPLSQ